MTHPIRYVALFAGLIAAALWTAPVAAQEAAGPAPVAELTAKDHPADGGELIVLSWKPSADDPQDVEAPSRFRYEVFRGGEQRGVFTKLTVVEPTERDYRHGSIRYTVEKCERGEPYYFRVVAVDSAGAESQFAQAGPAVATRQPFDGGRLFQGVITVLLCSAVIYWIWHARSGKPLKVRKIAGLEAVDEAVGRATEMGRSVLFIPGTQDMNDIQTIAGMTVLSRVSKTAAEYGARVEVPTSRSLVMTAARETVQASFLSAGCPDAYNEGNIFYVTDEQFGYVAFVTGKMVRDKPAACFYMGSFFAESLILAETGNSVGAIQVAGTAMPAQLPFFVAACDYTLIGEEFFAASAYLSGEPEQIGSLKGQDMGKLLATALLLVGFVLATIAELGGGVQVQDWLEYLKNTILS